MMVNLWASLLTCVTVVAAVSDYVPAESDVQRVMSHLESLMPLHLAAGKRLRRQAPTENGTSGEQPTTPPSLYVHFKYKKCCKKMPNLIDKKPVKKCLKALRPTRPPPPPEGPGGSPPPGGPGGPPPPGGPDRPPPPPVGPGGPPPPPPPSDIPGLPEDEDAEASDDIDSQNSGPSGQMHNGQGRIGAKSWIGGKHGCFRENVACAVECAFQNESLIKDGAVDQDAYKAYLEKYIQEKNASIWKDAIDAALQNCSLSPSTYINHEQKCKSGAMEMLECMERQIFVNCPESNWKDKDEKCDACRTSLENCGHKRRHHKWHKPLNETEEAPN